MKRLIFIFAILTGILGGAHGQMTFNDGHTNYYEAQWDGDTAAFGKGEFAHIAILMDDDRNLVRVHFMTGKWNGSFSNGPYFEPAAFGYSTLRELFDRICSMYYRAYDMTLHYTSGVNDTVHFYYDGVLQHSTALGWSGSNMTSVSNVKPE